MASIGMSQPFVSMLITQSILFQLGVISATDVCQSDPSLV